MSAIHHPNVPGWALHLQRAMNRVFASLAPGRSWFRIGGEPSFAVQPSDPSPSDPTRPAQAFTGQFLYLLDTDEAAEVDDSDDPSAPWRQRIAQESTEMWANVASGGVAWVRDNLLYSNEFQTLRRLPRTGFVLYGIRRLTDRMRDLEPWPAAAAALAAAMRRKFKGSLARSEMGSPAHGGVILAYLDGIARGAGLEPGLGGVVEEPWTRRTWADGTTAHVDENERPGAVDSR